MSICDETHRQRWQVNTIYTKTGLVFGFSKNQILVAVIPGQKAPRTLLGQISFWIYLKTILR
jgi:hypothetical protein